VLIVGDKPLGRRSVGWHTVMCYRGLERFRLLSAPVTKPSNLSRLPLIWSLTNRSHEIAESKATGFEEVDGALFRSDAEVFTGLKTYVAMCAVGVRCRFTLPPSQPAEAVSSGSEEAIIPSSFTACKPLAESPIDAIMQLLYQVRMPLHWD
jgi:hypothetical protein